MEATITDKKVHGSKDSEVIKEERNKKLSEAVWSFSLLELQFACAQQTVFVSFLSISGAESVLFLCSHKEKNQKKVRSAAGEKNPFRYASQRRADAIVASSFRRCHAMEDGFIFKTPRGGWRHSHAHGNPSTDIFYYHTNHLGSTAFVTDGNATITQGFVYAPFGEIVDEFMGMLSYPSLPKYAFNAKELDEETGMYYYEARYMAPPTFISRDPLFEKYFWMSPYHYCSNNPVGRVDPTGMLDGDPDDPPGKKTLTPQPQIVRQDNLASKPLPNTSYTSSPDAQGGDNSHPMATAGKETAGAYANASKAWNDYGKSHNGKQEQYKACYDASKKLNAKGVDVKTAQLKNGINQAAKYTKAAEGVNLIIDGAKVYAAYKTDGEQIGIETSKAVGGTVGGWAGTWAGSETGLYLGSIGGPFGAALGAVVGGFVGGMFGNAVGKQSGIGIYTRINRNK